tara:strand:- start:23889 stop:24443 length:555 start_codon:yes stop_codon:yes gene_type:complete
MLGIRKYTVMGLFVTSLLLFISCRNELNTMISIHSNELYIYHNGIDTLIKNYEQYNLMKPLMDEAGYHLKDTTMNWVPMPNESSQFIYYQIIDNQNVYSAGSIFFDSAIIQRFKAGRHISEYNQRISKMTGTQLVFSSVERIANRTESVVYLYRIHNDTLNIQLNYASTGTLVNSKEAYKYIEK